MPDNHLSIHTAGSVNPGATTVNDTYNIFEAVRPSRMDNYFRHLREEIENNTTREIIEDLIEYKTKLDGHKGLEEKLTDGGFAPNDINWAIRKKEQYAKKATQYECYPSAQEINLLLFGEIKRKFDRYIFPCIKRGESVETVMQKIDETIVSEIMKMLNDDGAYDEDLHYTSDHIYGMVYYLTGMCHLNWKDYDHV
jgi:hypothetical protein